LRKNAPPPPESMKKAGQTEILKDANANIAGVRNGGEVLRETGASPPATDFGQGVHEMSINPSATDAGPRTGAGYLLELELARERTRIRKLEEEQNAWKQEKKKLTEKVIAQCSAFADVYSQLPPEVVEPPNRSTTSLERYRGPPKPKSRAGSGSGGGSGGESDGNVSAPAPPADTATDTGAQQLLDRLLPILGHIGQTLQSLIASSSQPHNTFLILLLVIFTFSMTIIIMVYWIITTKLIWFLGIIMAMAILYAVTFSWNVKVRAEVERERVGVERERVGVERERVEIERGRIEVGREYMLLMGPHLQEGLAGGVMPRGLLPSPGGMRRVEELTDD
jgi:hypothetical protein